jgi:hypothetical protein
MKARKACDCVSLPWNGYFSNPSIFCSLQLTIMEGWASFWELFVFRDHLKTHEQGHDNKHFLSLHSFKPLITLWLPQWHRRGAASGELFTIAMLPCVSSSQIFSYGTTLQSRRRPHLSHYHQTTSLLRLTTHPDGPTSRASACCDGNNICNFDFVS